MMQFPTILMNTKGSTILKREKSNSISTAPLLIDYRSKGVYCLVCNSKVLRIVWCFGRWFIGVEFWRRESVIDRVVPGFIKALLLHTPLGNKN